MRNDRVCLRHIRDALLRIEHYTRGKTDEFFTDTMIQDAVIRNLEIAGHAAEHLSSALRAARPEIPWDAVGGMQEVLSGSYFAVDLHMIWDTVQQRLPQLRRRVESLLAESEGESLDSGDPGDHGGKDELPVERAVSRKDRAYLRRIHECIEEIEDHTGEGEQEFFRNRMMQYPVLKNLRFIGDAAKSLSRSARASGPPGLWTRLAELDERLGGDMLSVDLRTAWDGVQHCLPELKSHVEAVLAEPERGRL
jgi:uncharacterized protein with HEPN domain